MSILLPWGYIIDRLRTFLRLKICSQIIQSDHNWSIKTLYIIYTQTKVKQHHFFRKRCFGSCRTEYVGNGNQIF